MFVAWTARSVFLMQTQISSVPCNAVLSQCFLTLLCLKSSSSRSLWKHGLSAVLVFCGEVTVFHAHWSCNLWSKKCSLYITIQLHKLGKWSLMLVCHEIGWCHKITALCGYSDCYPHGHNPLLSLEYSGQKKVPLRSQASNCLAKGRCHKCPEQQLGTRPFGTCNFTKFSYKSVESRL